MAKIVQYVDKFKTESNEESKTAEDEEKKRLRDKNETYVEEIKD